MLATLDLVLDSMLPLPRQSDGSNYKIGLATGVLKEHTFQQKHSGCVRSCHADCDCTLIAKFATPKACQEGRDRMECTDSIEDR